MRIFLSSLPAKGKTKNKKKTVNLPTWHLPVGQRIRSLACPPKAHRGYLQTRLISCFEGQLHW